MSHSRTRRRILFLAPFPPAADGLHGGSRAIAGLVQAVARRQRVALAYLRAGDEPGVDAATAALCEVVSEVARPGVSGSSLQPRTRAPAVLARLARGKPLWVGARWHPAFAAHVLRLAAQWRPHVVQAEFSAMGQYLEAARGAGARTVVRIHEPGVTASRERVASGAPGRVFWRLEAGLWARFERSVLDRADATVVLTERDAAVMRSLHPGARLERIPLGVAIPPAPASAVGTEAASLLFVGNFDHPPNVDAARWLVDDIVPRLRRRVPDARLQVVGSGARACLGGAQRAGVAVMDRVPDLAPYVERAALVVAPMRRGGGMRVKVLEALAAGKALVATPLAVEGLSLTDGEHVVLADTSDAMADALASLLADPGRRTALAAAGRERVASCFGWCRIAKAHEALYERLLEPEDP